MIGHRAQSKGGDATGIDVRVVLFPAQRINKLEDEMIKKRFILLTVAILLVLSLLVLPIIPVTSAGVGVEASADGIVMVTIPELIAMNSDASMTAGAAGDANIGYSTAVTWSVATPIQLWTLTFASDTTPVSAATTANPALLAALGAISLLSIVLVRRYKILNHTLRNLYNRYIEGGSKVNLTDGQRKCIMPAAV